MTSTGKKARKRYGNRFAAKRRRADGSAKRRASRRTWGKLPFSVIAKNVPEGAVRTNADRTEAIAEQRAAAGWPQDANVAVPGRTFESWDAEQREAREIERRAEKLRRRQEREVA